MSKTDQKLGRNPLEQLNNPKGHGPTLGMHALGVGSVERSDGPKASLANIMGTAVVKGSSLEAAVEKVREMQIQIDWKEVYATTVGKKIKKLSRFFHEL